MIITVTPVWGEIKNGYSARVPALRSTYHGRTQQIAAENLKRGVRLFFSPAEREGRLTEVLERLGVDFEDDGGPIQVRIREQ